MIYIPVLMINTDNPEGSSLLQHLWTCFINQGKALKIPFSYSDFGLKLISIFIIKCVPEDNNLFTVQKNLMSAVEKQRIQHVISLWIWLTIRKWERETPHESRTAWPRLISGLGLNDSVCQSSYEINVKFWGILVICSKSIKKINYSYRYDD